MKAFKHWFFAWIFPWVPKRLLSRLVGVLMRLRLGPLAGLLIPPFAWFFKIQVEEAEFPPSHYRSWDDFFTRRLRAGLRPIHASFVHPVDGRLTSQGKIQHGQMVQAKGWTYDLGEFLGAAGANFEGGQYFTWYLCPADYHRVHSPCEGQLVSARHIPGLLWPVNDWSVSNIRRLFCLNERVVLNFVAPQGRWSLVMVGATNVGRMTISLDPSITTNRWMWHAPTERQYSPALPVKAGDELGMFHLGSTVIAVFESGFGLKDAPAGAVRLGEALEAVPGSAKVWQ
jgi:phosphatidylserine decarboxylase